jgi:DNA-binding winged helix-turn-helix (wHTH) protein
MRLRFGEVVVDTETRELLRGGRALHLSPKAFELLCLLAQNRPKALSKAELQKRLWPDTFVMEANLSNLVGEIRAALGDQPRRPRFIRTVQRFGYAFQGEATEAPPLNRGEAAAVPACRLTWKGGRSTLGEGEHVLGRDPTAEICLDSSTVSRRHARIRVAGDQAVLEDLGSKNGTFLNGQPVRSPLRLSHGSEIRLGAVRLTFRVLRPAGSTETGSASER